MNRLWFRLLLIAPLAVASCGKKQDPKPALNQAVPRTLSSFDLPGPGDKLMAPQSVKFDQADLAQVLNLYGEISGRSIIWPRSLPPVKITFSNQTPMTPVGVLQALDTVLAAQGITTVVLGTQYLKVIPSNEASQESSPVIELPAEQLPDSSSFCIYFVRLKNVSASQVVPAVQPFAKLANSIIAINGGVNKQAPGQMNLPKLTGGLIGPKDHSILILRDYSSNVRRILQVVEQLDK